MTVEIQDSALKELKKLDKTIAKNILQQLYKLEEYPNISNIKKLKNHNNKEKTHDIKIKPNTILYKIFGPTLTVNSRHNEALSKVNYPFKVSAVSKDNVIEGIEYVDDNHFVLGVQFHPEDLDNTENLYNYFLKEVLKRKK